MELVYTILCIVCLCVGFFYGYKIGKNEKITTPVEKVKEAKAKQKVKKEEKEANEKMEKELKKLNIVWDNINSYDGTSQNQKEVE